MAIIRPFKALRPQPNQVKEVASFPYDVINSEEAREIAGSNKLSFLRISKPEIDLPKGTDEHAAEVYTQGQKNLQLFLKEQWLVEDSKPCYYIYRQIMGNHSQIGLVACSAVDDYQNNVIKKHEHTRADKEEDRVLHIDVLDANDEPVFYTYVAKPEIDALTNKIVSGKPVYDFATSDEVKHTLWVVDSDADIKAYTEMFGKIPTLYVADGHHRSAAASRTRDKRKAQNPKHTGNEEYNFFMTVIFPHNQMQLWIITVSERSNGLTKESFIAKISEKFEIAETTEKKPKAKHTYSMYLDGKWYALKAKANAYNEKDIVSTLDVSILQNNILDPLLGIKDPRKDQRINFVGGIRGLG
jgi:uncharacterized protein (DUF1015 family)